MSSPLLLRDTRAASAAEFAIVLPLLILLIFGIIDAGRYAWEYNRAEKAAQVGVRVAVVTDVVPHALAETEFVGTVNCDPNGDGVYDTCTQGDIIKNPNAIPEITCTSTTCSPAAYATETAGAMARIIARMQNIKPDIAASNVELHYTGSGLGFAGDPNGMQISPIVTVRLTDLQFRPIALLALTSFPFSVQASLTAEDEAGAQSN